MKKRVLGKTGIEISELGYGCSALFGKDFLGKQGITFDHAMSLIKTALDSGITFFDTGFNYGYAEERLGQCLVEIFKNNTWKREDLVVQTKGCETLKEDGSYGSADYSAEWIKRSVDISLKRLQLDYIDLYALHGAAPEVLSDELFYLFEDMKSQKIIRAYGVCGISDDFGYWISEKKCFDYVMMTYNYTQARRNKLIKTISDNNIGVLVGGSLNHSLNSIKHFPRNKRELWYLTRAIAHFRGDLSRSKSFDFISHVDGMTPQQISLAYILSNDHISSASFNTIKVNHILDNIASTKMELPEEIKTRIEAIR